MTQEKITEVCVLLGWSVDFADSGHYVVFSKWNDIAECEVGIKYDDINDIPSKLEDYRKGTYNVDEEAVYMYQTIGGNSLCDCLEASEQNVENIKALDEALVNVIMSE
jgi:hypothetical protein